MVISLYTLCISVFILGTVTYKVIHAPIMNHRRNMLYYEKHFVMKSFGNAY